MNCCLGILAFDAYDYRTMKSIAFDYDVSKSRVYDAVKWVENTLIKDVTFSLPSKRVLTKLDTEIDVVIIDVTECETERPKKNKKNRIPANKMPHNKRPNID